MKTKYIMTLVIETDAKASKSALKKEVKEVLDREMWGLAIPGRGGLHQVTAVRIRSLDFD